MKVKYLLTVALWSALNVVGQNTFPINGVQNNFEETHAFVNATLVISPQQSIENGTLIIKGDKIVRADSSSTLPKGAIIHDLNGKFIYPSFIDLQSSYGMPDIKKSSWKPQPQYNSKNKSGAGWNQAIHPEFNANSNFSTSNDKAKSYRSAGFGAVLTHQEDGISRGSGVFVSLADDNENITILKGTSSAHYSLSKGSSRQKFPSSLMGTLALIHQTYLDAEWYEQKPKGEFNRSLQAWNELQDLPQFFEVKDKLDIARVWKIADEFEIEYTIVGNGDEYQRVDDLRRTNFSIVVPVDFPDAYEVSNPQMAEMISLQKLKHWELAPTNPARLVENGILVALTSEGLEKRTDFISKLRSAVKHGLSKSDALATLTTNPAELIESSKLIGTLTKGKIANFLICDEDIFEEGTIESNWIQGNEYIINSPNVIDSRGIYLTNNKDTLIISGPLDKNKVTLMQDTNEVKLTLEQEGHHFNFNYETEGVYRISSLFNDNKLKGFIHLPNGEKENWSAVLLSRHEEEVQKEEEEITPNLGELWFPNMAYGWKEPLQQENIIFRNATLWTNEHIGIVEGMDVAISNGKIAAIGKDLVGEKVFKKESFRDVEAEGKHITSGIIDEHSHIAISRGVNEGSQASSAEVSIANVINSDDINIYRQLSGGVTSAQLLHGSANPIGGQSGMIKLRWGSSPDEMKFEGAAGFIKFALGENVKQANWGDYERVRFPQTRMGVEQVFYDHFLRAKEYKKEWEEYNKLSLSARRLSIAPREDLEMNTLVEILESERFITCHSYVQSEINMLMHVADSMGFRMNTFTHILEGYKVADKMKKHGVGGSTFSDWWAYKFEVNDAIPYNASILSDMGIVTALNSDDAEMARRLNQEAAKIVKYGGVSQEEAWKMVTLNPAKLLHIDDKVGSIKVGKDADIVVWTDNPLSVYTKVEQTYIDGKCYFDKEKDEQLREVNKIERARLIQKMLVKNEAGGPTQKVTQEVQRLYHCDSLEDHHSNHHHH